MTLAELYLWHREQAERFADNARNHKTTGAPRVIDAVTRRYNVQAQFHQEAAALLKPLVAA